MDLVDGQTVDFSMITGVQACAVPLPGAVWLLVSGLAGVIGFRRRS